MTKSKKLVSSRNAARELQRVELRLMLTSNPIERMKLKVAKRNWERVLALTNAAQVSMIEYR